MPTRRQAFIWRNDGKFTDAYMRHWAPLSLKQENIGIIYQNIIYITITKNIRYLLWNRWVWRFFHDTYLTIEVQGIQCTNHLHDSCPLTDVNPQFTAPGCRYFKINSRWPIVTSSTHGPDATYCDVTMAHCSYRYLWPHDVEDGAS